MKGNPLRRDNRCSMKATPCRQFAITGLIGLTLGLALNLLALTVFRRHSAVYFSLAWWNAWFPNYVVWSTFTVIGFASRFWDRSPAKARA
jgi:hypothetical protein